MNLRLLNLSRSANGVKRFHTLTNVITTETVGHHTANMLSIIFAVYDQEPPLKLVEAALYHDTPEYITGDIPATAKWDFPALQIAVEDAEKEIVETVGYGIRLEPEEAYVLKFADLLDLAMKASTEAICGNREMHAVLHNVLSTLGPMIRENLPHNTNVQNLYATFLQDAHDARE